MDNSNTALSSFVRSLIAKDGEETEILEFKSNIYDAEKLGKTISAMSNSAALAGMPSAYIVFGVEDRTMCFVGTDFHPNTYLISTKKRADIKTNQLLLPWLASVIQPQISLQFHCFTYVPESQEENFGEIRLVLLEIPAASFKPTSFQHVRYIRNGASVAVLDNFTDREIKLWDVLKKNSFLQQLAQDHLTDLQILNQLDVQQFMRDRKLHPDMATAELLQQMVREKLLTHAFGMYGITNLGALLYARDLTVYESVAHRIIRVAHYTGASRSASCIEERFSQGYAVEFKALMDKLMSFIPNGERLRPDGYREMHVAVPVTAVREILANCMVHQDITSKDSVIISVFFDRIEFVNPGEPDIPVNRFIDSFSGGRNEQLAAYMNRIGLCEGRVEGVDKAVNSLEQVHSIAPLIDVLHGATRVVLPFNRPYEQMSALEKLNSCLAHCTLCFLDSHYMTNTSLRDRFGLSADKTMNISQLIRSAVKQGLIKPQDGESSRKNRCYVPFWVQ